MYSYYDFVINKYYDLMPFFCNVSLSIIQLLKVFLALSSQTILAFTMLL